MFIYDFEQVITLIWTYIFIYNISLIPIFAILFQLQILNIKTINLLSSIGYNFTLTKILTIAFFSTAGIPPFLGFFSKIFVLILICNNHITFVFILLFILLFTSLYFYIQNIRFLNTSNTQNKNSIFEKNIRVTYLLYHLCLPLVFILIFGFILIDDLFIFFKWCLN